MILDIILSVVSFLINGLASILPTFTIFPTTLSIGIATVMGFISGWAWLIPVNVVMAVFAVLVLLGAAEFAFLSGMFVLRFIAKR